MKRARSSLAIIAVLAVLTFLAVAGTLSAAQSKTTVVVAAKYLEPGTRLSERDVTTKRIHSGAVLEGAFTDPEEPVGQTLTIARAPGDQITASMVGESAQSALAQALPPDHRAVAVKVTRSQGLAGLLRPGDRVSIIAIVNPQNVLQQIYRAEEEKLSQPRGPMAKITLTGLRILFVPWDFRYQEATPTEEEGLFAPVVTTRQGQENGVIVLDVPVTPITVTWALPTPAPTAAVTATGTVTTTTAVEEDEERPPSLLISPAELLALLDNTEAEIHLALEPAEAEEVPTIGVSLGDIVFTQLEVHKEEER